MRLFVRRDAYGRFVSCLIFVPRESYNTDLRVRIQADPQARPSTARASEFTVHLSDSVLGAHP